MIVSMILYKPDLQMRYYKMLEAGKCIHSYMDSQVITESRSQRRTNIRWTLRQNGVIYINSDAIWTEECSNCIFKDSSRNVEIHAQVFRSLPGSLDYVKFSKLAYSTIETNVGHIPLVVDLVGY